MTDIVDLPDGTVLRDADGFVWERISGNIYGGGHGWFTPGEELPTRDSNIAQPFMVLYLPPE